MNKFFFLSLWGLFFVTLVVNGQNSCPGIDTVQYGGMGYPTVRIQNQCWLKKNLNIGSQISSTSQPSNNGIVQKWCYLNLESYCSQYGGLYSFDEANNYFSNNNGICPSGWHLPSLSEINVLIGTVITNVNAMPGQSTSGFDALLGGFLFSGSFGAISERFYFWSSNTYQLNKGYLLTNGTTGNLSTNNIARTSGLSVRCIKDIMVSSTITPVTSCNPVNGAVVLSVFGGTSPYSVSWSNGVTTFSNNGLSAGTYSVTVTSQEGFTENLSFNVPSSINLAASAAVIPVSCFGGSNGSVNLTVNGNYSPNSFIWSNGSTNEDLTGISSGNYVVTVTNSIGCHVIANGVVNQPSAPLTLSFSQVNVSCFGVATGSIDLTPSGGTSPYFYNWNGGLTTQDRSNLTAGFYQVVVTDANGCSATGNCTITQPPSGLSLSFSQINNPCFGANSGSIDLSPSGGTSPYVYLWSMGSSNQDISGLSSGIYSVTVWDSHGCLLSSSRTVTQPANLSLTFIQQNVACFGASTGAIDMTVSGGNPPYAYFWNGGISTQDRSGLSAGIYSATISDVNGCFTTTSKTISQPATPLVISFSQTNILCSGNSSGSIDLSPGGGTSPYFYSWSNGQTTQDLFAIQSGIYSVSVTDINGCAIDGSRTVTQPVQGLSLSFAQINNSCYGNNSGSIDLTVSGGTLPYNFIWTGGVTTEDRTGLTAGSYSVTVTDGNGCLVNAIRTITQPSLLNLAIEQVNIGCFGNSTGSLDLTPSGGTPPYSYYWNGGMTTQDRYLLLPGTYSVTVTDWNGCVKVASRNITQPLIGLSLEFNQVNVLCFGGSTGSLDLTPSGGTSPYSYQWEGGVSTQDRFNIPSGAYFVTVSDANGCSILGSWTITQPFSPLALSFVQTNVNCYGGFTGSLITNPSGGVTPYSYLWNGGVTTKDLSGLSASEYSLLLIDANGCNLTSSRIISQPNAPLEISLSPEPIACFGGNTGVITLSLSGGTNPYSFLWSDNSTLENRAGLTSGNYSVTATDSNSCLIAGATFVSQPPSALEVGFQTIHQVSCFGKNDGNLDVLVQGGISPYSYNWNDGFTNEDRSSLSVGQYFLTVTSASGCQMAVDQLIIEPSPVTSSHFLTDINCHGNLNGSIQVLPSGGTPPYEYYWNSGVGSGILSGLAAGNYSITINDSHSCAYSESFVLNEPPLLSLSATTSIQPYYIDLSITGGTFPFLFQWSSGSTIEDIYPVESGNYVVTVTDHLGCQANLEVFVSDVSVTLTPVSCYGAHDGAISVESPVPGSSFTWSNGSTTASISGVFAGVYWVTVSNVNGIYPASFTVTGPNPIEINSQINEGCFGLNNGSIGVSVVGGTPPYSFYWNDGNTLQDRLSLLPGTYSLIVHDANLCEISQQWILDQPEGINMVGVVNDVNCFGEPSGSISISASGGNPPYSYFWSNGESGQYLTGLLSGSYSVVGFDANGCQFGDSYTVIEPLSATFDFSTTHVSCFGMNSGNILLSVSGGTEPYSYFWSNEGTTSVLSNLGAGAYFVTVIDNFGCSFYGNTSVFQPESEIFIFSNQVDVQCYGEGNGALDLTITGGTSPYQIFWGNGAYSEDQVGLQPGEYGVTVIDMVGCDAFGSFEISQPTEPLGISLISTPVQCYGEETGSINLLVFGGTSPYQILWSNGTTDEDLFSLAEGVYFVTVTDSHFCQKTGNVTVSQPSSPLSIGIHSNHVACHGANTGSLVLFPSGGSVPYSYHWTTGATSENIINLSAGFYGVTLMDSQGCWVQGNAQIYQPDTLIIWEIEHGEDLCNSGLGYVATQLSGGTGPFTFLWNSGVTSSYLSNLSLGNYFLTVTDYNGCEAVMSTTILNQMVTPVFLNDVVATSGSTLSLTAPISGGDYLWNNGATSQAISITSSGYYVYSFTLGACSYIDTIQVLFGSALGPCGTTLLYGGANYETVAIGSQCWMKKNLNIGNRVTASPSGQADDGVIQKFCYNNNENFCSSYGGMYQWNELMNYQNQEGAQGICPLGWHIPTNTEFGILFSEVGSNSANLRTGTAWSGLAGGVFSAGAFMDLGSKSRYWTSNSSGLNSTFRELPESGSGFNASIAPRTDGFFVRCIRNNEGLSYSLTVTPVGCKGGTSGGISLSVSGGVPPYYYSWNSGANTQNLSNLPAGVYQVTITDGSQSQLLAQAVVTEPPSLIAFSDLQNVSCKGGSNGSIGISVSGGTVPYSYSWSTGSGLSQISGLFAGNYHLTVADNHGCKILRTFFIHQPDSVDVSLLMSPIPCYGGSSTITVSATGGIAPYTGTGEFVVGAGSHSYTVTDTNGCAAIANLTINEPTLLTASALTTPILCNGGTSTVTVSATGGTAPYTGIGEFVVTAGNHSYPVSAANGCSTSVDVAVTEPALLSISTVSTAILCNGGSSTVTVSATGGTAPYTGVGSFEVPAGTYTCNVIDANGCTTSVEVVVTEPSVLSASAESTVILCNGGSSTVTVTATGGTAPYTGTGEFVVVAGSQTYTVTDTNGCEALLNLTINEPTLLMASAVTTPILCNGGTSTVTVSATAGTGPYTGIGEFVVSAGTHSYPVSDANGCSSSVDVVVTEPALLSISAVSTSILCNGGTSTVTVSATGGTAPYTGIGEFVVGAGNHSFTVNDANGCSAVANLVIIEPTALVVTTDSTAILCNGGLSTVTISASGGTAPYSGIGSFLLVAGTYSYSVTDSNGCISVTNFSLAENSALSAASVVTNPILCYGGQAVVSVSASGGSGSYTGVGTFNLVAGDYTFTVSDDNGCTSVAIISVTQPDVLEITGSIGNATQNGVADGFIDLSVTGGTGPFVYVWSNGATTEDLSGLFAGFYSVTLLDSNSCLKQVEFVVGQPVGFNVSTGIQPISCQGSADGSIQVVVTGGIGPFQFLWSNGMTGSGIGSLGPGVYWLTVTDSDETYSIFPYNLVEPMALESQVIYSAILCNGGTSTVTVSAAGGTAPYTGLGEYVVNAGSHSFLVSDSNGCTTSVDVVVAEPSVLIASAESTAILCNGGLSTVTVSATGGTAPYTGVGSFEVSAGSYTFNVIDANGCSTSVEVVVTEPSVLTASAETTSILCHGGLSTVTVSATGGTAPYMGVGGFEVFAGTYTYGVIDANGCSFNVEVVVAEPSVLTASGGSTAVLCHGGLSTVMVNATGGTAPYTGIGNFEVLAGTYTYNLMDANGCSTGVEVVVTEPSVLTASAESNAILCNGGLSTVTVSATGGTAPYTGVGSFEVSAGTYTYNVIDANGCSSSVEVVVTEPSVLTASAETTSILCHGGLSTVTISATGGMAPYMGVGSFEVSAGTYSYIVIDANGCSASIEVIVTEPSVLTASAESTAILCNGGLSTVTVSATGGTTPYTGIGNFEVSAGIYTYNLIDANGCATSVEVVATEPSVLTASAESTAILCNGGSSTVTVTATGGNAPYAGIGGFEVSAGTYTYNVTDANGCSNSVDVVITEPSIIALTYTSTAILCNGGSSSVTVVATGGTAPYSGIGEFMVGSGNQTFVVTDANGCVTSLNVAITEPPSLTASFESTPILCNGGTSTVAISATGGTAPFTGIGEYVVSSGSHSYPVSDANGCSTNVDVVVTEPALLTASAVSTTILCNGGFSTVNVSATGGTAPYMGVGSFEVAAGIYTYPVSDSNGCTTSVDVVVTEPAPLTVSAEQSGIPCPGGLSSILVSAQGGTSPYSGTGTTFLPGGVHNLVVADANACLQSLTFAVTAPAPITLDIISLSDFHGYDISCANSTNGILFAQVTGMSEGYSLLWSNSSTNDTITGVGAGVYSVSLTNSGGCSWSDSYTILAPPSLSNSLVSQEVLCFDQATGSVDLIVGGGVSPYFFTWSNGQTTEDIAGLGPGYYSVFVEDQNACHGNGFTYVSAPSQLVVSALLTDPTCAMPQGGAIDLQVSGGSAPYGYQWSQGSTIGDLSGLVGGIYNLTVTDANDCSIQNSFSLNEPSGMALTATLSSIPECGNFGAINLSVSGGPGPFVFLWSNGATTEDLSGLPGGDYVVTVSNGSGCMAVGTWFLDQPSVSISFTLIHPSCYEEANGQINLSVSGGSGSYQFIWSTGATTEDLDGLPAGTYSLTLTAPAGCGTTYSFALSEPEPLELELFPINPTSVIAGSIASVVTGGVSPYTYLWSNGASTPDISGLSAGSWYLTVTDSRQCAVTFWAHLVQVPAGWTVTETDLTHFILIPGSASISISGQAISEGDLLGVFFTDNGTLHCAGFTTWTAGTTAMSVFGNDGLTPEKDGFDPGEPFIWKIWRPVQQVEYPVTATYDPGYDPGNFLGNGFSILSSLTYAPFQEIILSQGWSYVSTYMVSGNPSVSTVFAPVVSHVSIIKNTTGQMYWPQYNINTIGGLVLGQAYQVKMNVTDTLSVTGTPCVPQLNPVPLSNGWNLLGYLRQSAGSIQQMLAPIVGSVSMVKTSSGQMYWPVYGINQIGNMYPGKGYQIKMTAAATLTYPANTATSEKADERLSEPAYFQKPVPTDQNMSLGLMFEPGDLPEDAEVGVFDSGNLLVGSGVGDRGFTALTLWGDDLLTPWKDGLVDGEAFQVRLYHPKSHEVSVLHIGEWKEGSGRFEAGQISIAGGLTLEEAYPTILLSPAYPNPFTGHTEIGFSIPRTGFVRLEVFGLLGQRVGILADGELRAGMHQLVWDAAGLAPGPYLLCLRYGDQIATQLVSKSSQ